MATDPRRAFGGAAPAPALKVEGPRVPPQAEEAEKAIGDGEHRLLALNDEDRERLLLQVRRMRGVIAGIRSSIA